MSSLFRVSLCSSETLAPGCFSRRRATRRVSSSALALAAGVAFCVAGGVIDARAAEWFVSGEVRQDVEYDDNIGLDITSDEVVSDVGFTSSIVANAGASTPNLNIRLDTQFDFTVFPNEDQLNSNDQYVVVGSDYQYGRSLWGVEGQFVRDTSRTSDVNGTGEFLLDNKRREVFRLGPSWSYQLSPRNSLDTSATYTNVNYPNGTSEAGDGAGLRDYEEYSGNVGFTHVWSPRTQLLASLGGSYYNSNKFGSLDNQVVGLAVGASHALTERIRVTATAGPYLAHQDSRDADQSSSQSTTNVGYSADASIGYQAGERTFLEAQFTRSAEPNTSTGDLQDRNEIRLFGEHKILEKVAINLTSRYFVQDQISSDDSNATRQYASVQPGFSWRLIEDLSLNCYYRFRWQYLDDVDKSGDSNAVYARLIYDLPRLSTSR